MRPVSAEIGSSTERPSELSHSSLALVPLFAASRSRFLALLSCLFALHIVVRLITSPVAALDESEQLVFTQAWQWGYGPQPPLYTWLQILVFKVFGVSLFGLALLKNMLLFATYAFIYASARLITRSHAGGVMAALSLLFIPQFGWESHRDLTHSVLVTAAAAATLATFLKLQEERSPGLYLCLGVAFGLGMLSNYSYGLLVAGVLVGALCVKEFRNAVLTPWMLGSAAIALTLVLPHMMWARENAATILSTSHKLRIQSEPSHIPAFVYAVANVAGAWFSHIISIVLVFVVLCWKQVVSFPRAVFARPSVRFLSVVLASAVACVLISMFATGATTFKGRWMQPIYLCVPILLVAFIHERLTARALRRILTAAGLVAMAVMVVLPTRVWFAGKLDRLIELNAPYPALAKQIGADAARARLIAADSMVVGGNFRLLLPGKPVITPRFDDLREASLGGTALVVFDATFNPEPSPELRRWASTKGLELSLQEVRYVEAQIRSGHDKRMRLGFLSVSINPTRPDSGRP